MATKIHPLTSDKTTPFFLKPVLALSSFAATAAMAATNLPGGPAYNQLNLPIGVTKISQDQSWLHWYMLVICTVVFIAVFSVMFYSIWKHRKSKGHKAATFHDSLTVEIAWTLTPFLIVIAMAWPATKTVIAMKDTTNSDLTIKATGMQWQWGYDYIRGEGEGIGFISALDKEQRLLSNQGGPKSGMTVNDYLLKVDNPLVVPVNKKVRLITTANDVIHAWAVQSLGVRQDAIPGFVRDTWFRAEKEGDYYGQCAELCGKEHAYMPIHVKVLSQENYSKWVLAEKAKNVPAPVKAEEKAEVKPAAKTEAAAS